METPNEASPSEAGTSSEPIPEMSAPQEPTAPEMSAPQEPTATSVSDPAPDATAAEVPATTPESPASAQTLSPAESAVVTATTGYIEQAGSIASELAAAAVSVVNKAPATVDAAVGAAGTAIDAVVRGALEDGTKWSVDPKSVRAIETVGSGDIDSASAVIGSTAAPGSNVVVTGDAGTVQRGLQAIETHALFMGGEFGTAIRNEVGALLDHFGLR